MDKDFCNYNQSMRLKALGFDEPCLAYFDCERESKFNPNKRMFLSCEILRPTFSQAFRYFRHYYKLDGWVVPFINLKGERLYDIIIQGFGDDYNYESVDCKTHEEAESICVDELIRIVELKKK